MAMELLDSLVGATEFSRNPRPYIDRASDGESIVILKGSRPTAVLIDIQTGRRLDHLDSLEDDLRLLAVALVRMAADSGKRYDLDDVLGELGIELDDEDDGDGEDNED
ncbi:type II toxin-antitoxin system prevent-host-death family antitoxin [uncultured Amnibacterium sp.]|uniref:type II toxin-antitoxin system prevent-host-death family antitoxin n=1 Tax=uncultured Amnibacterium sp. TaxID=1631851 RepID=UPI0035C97374